ncbi:diguanylate cyclase [Agrobacterium sp. fls2-241-TYG-188a]|uniref:GGDEF domain-containing response regulator n=1 Tax=Agrobacterium sp. fls2-241-TYG-188a TaxID=3040275 RepID=UPI000DD6446D|nr:diguanylate cyclase [Agrobacterium sp. fls2-241-TYG-188a]
MRDKILLIEDSVALSILLKTRLADETNAEIFHCETMSQTADLLKRHKFTLALTGLTVPDAPNGEILNLLEKRKVPTIVFTATVDEQARQHYAEKKIIDYIVKDGRRTVDTVVKTVDRILANRQFSILIVDDAKAARSSLKEILTRQNFTVQEAYSGAQALDILASNPSIQLVITDYYMPDMDGYELTRLIRAGRSSEELRIIGVSSSTDRMLSAHFLKAGASDFIYRPFVPEELQCRIDNNVETLKQLMRLRELAEKDHLSGLPNRRSFFDHATGLLENLKVTGARGAVAIVDIDHFKQINDTFGHSAGDKALKMLANLLSDFCSKGEHLAARIGGEEFAIFLKGLDGQQAHAFCESLRQEVAANAESLVGSEIPLTISVGVVEVEKGGSLDQQLTAADQLLYIAKANGRNCVYSDVMARRELSRLDQMS